MAPSRAAPRPPPPPTPWGAFLLSVAGQVPFAGQNIALATSHETCTCRRLTDAPATTRPPLLALDAEIRAACPLLEGPVASIALPMSSYFGPTARIVPCGLDDLVTVDRRDRPLLIPTCYACDGASCADRWGVYGGVVGYSRVLHGDQPDGPWTAFLREPWVVVDARQSCTDVTVQMQLPGQTSPVVRPVRCVTGAHRAGEARVTLSIAAPTALEIVPAASSGDPLTQPAQVALLGVRAGRTELSWARLSDDQLILTPQGSATFRSDDRPLALHGFVHPDRGPLLAVLTARPSGQPTLRVLTPPTDQAPAAVIYTSSGACVPETCAGMCVTSSSTSCGITLPEGTSAVLTSGDLDGDGLTDLALAATDGTTLLRFFTLTASSSPFRAGCRCSEHGRPLRSLVLTRMGGPGPADDLVIGDSTGVYVQWSSAGGCLGCGSARSLAVDPALLLGHAPLSGTGIDDLLIANTADGRATLSCRPTDGLPQCTVARPYLLDTGDFDGDGRLDGVTPADFYYAGASNAVGHDLGYSAVRRAADLDGDGRSDLVDLLEQPGPDGEPVGVLRWTRAFSP